MKNPILLPVIVLVLAGAFALGQGLPSTLPSKNRQGYITRSPQAQAYGWEFQIGGKRYHARITQEEIKRGPDWTPSMPLPLSFPKVEEIARAQLNKLVGDSSSWELTDLQLKRIPGEDQRAWFYVVGLKPTDETSMQAHESFFAVMNLSGVVGKIAEEGATK
jgi:hypothetical protein